MSKIADGLKGSEFFNSEGDKVIIKEYVGCNEVYVVFEGYEYILKTSMRVLRKGEIKNRLKPSVCGVGYLGYDLKSPTSHFLYVRWQSMLDRCYNPQSSDYASYGAKGITVCDNWKNFSTYVKDIESMENYQSMLANPKSWHIDKDLKGGSTYSKENCCIILAEVNVLLSSKSGLKKAIRQLNPDGSLIKEFDSIKSACDECGYNRVCLSNCLNGKTKTSYGFHWEFV